MTSWNDEQLERLVNIDNHKMVKDSAGETRWMHSLLNGVWDIHSIKVFEEEKLAYSWLYFWITKWDEELRLRKSTRAIQVRKRLKRIKRSVRMLVSDKVIELSELLPSYTHTDIANELSISTKSVQRALKQMSS
tara:strand:- start:362 stop:763 length:402 start_codon:yes stop_codon:yes gene_type:complete